MNLRRSSRPSRRNSGAPSEAAASRPAASPALLLDGRAWYRAIRGEDAAIAGLGAQVGLTPSTFVEPNARVRGHRFSRLAPAAWARNDGFQFRLHGAIPRGPSRCPTSSLSHLAEQCTCGMTQGFERFRAALRTWVRKVASSPARWLKGGRTPGGVADGEVLEWLPRPPDPHRWPRRSPSRCHGRPRRAGQTPASPLRWTLLPSPPLRGGYRGQWHDFRSVTLDPLARSAGTAKRYPPPDHSATAMPSPRVQPDDSLRNSGIGPGRHGDPTQHPACRQPSSGPVVRLSCR